MRIVFFILFLASWFVISPAFAAGEVRYIFAKSGSDGELTFTVAERRMREDELYGFFQDHKEMWPKDKVELRVIFSNSVSLAWFEYGCRYFNNRGFKNIRCYSASEESRKAVEMKAVDSLNLPPGKW